MSQIPGFTIAVSRLALRRPSRTVRAARSRAPLPVLLLSAASRTLFVCRRLDELADHLVTTAFATGWMSWE